MENPYTWGRAEIIVHNVVHDHFVNMAQDDPIVGLSLERQITDALRAEGLLAKEPAAPPGEDTGRNYPPAPEPPPFT